MLLCSPTTYVVHHEFPYLHDSKRSNMNGSGSYGLSQSSPRIRRPMSRSQAQSSSHSQPSDQVPNIISSHSLSHSHDPFSHNPDAWQSNISYRSSPESQVEMATVLPFTTQELINPAATSAWSPQDALETAGWQDASGMNNFMRSMTVPTGFQWDAATVPDQGWYNTGVSTESIATTAASAPNPYRHESFFAYKRQEATEPPPTFAEMDMTAEIQYPNLYASTAQTLSTPIHSGLDTNVADVEALQQVIEDHSPLIQDPLLLSTPARQAISAMRAKGPPKPHSHSHGAITKPKAAPKGGRVGPLSLTQREKVEDMRSYGACWRCRKYKKPCNGPGICDTCVTSGFRVWPSALGCRRGDFDSFAFGMIPTHSEQIVGQMVLPHPIHPTRREMVRHFPSGLFVPDSAAHGDKFEQLMYKVQATELTGRGVLELLQIACNLQRGLTKESRVLAATLKGLGHACEFYSCFVATAENPSTLRSRYDLVNIFTQNRKALLTTLSSFLNSCLTGRMKDWLPTFLSANFIVYTFVMLSDAALMVPDQFRDKLWASIQAIVMDFRNILYPMAQDLLSALGKGSKLLHMQCWNMVEVPSKDNEPATMERNREGMRILDGELAIFDGLRALQIWLEDFGPTMRGDLWYANAPHSNIPPICSWERMFDFSPRG